MIRHYSLLSLRTCAVLLAGLVIALAVAYDGRGAPPAGADPAFGNAKINPTAGVVIEGHYVTIPVLMTTCADNATPPSFTATAGGASTVTVSGSPWTTNQWQNYDIQLTSGTGSPQWRVIASNTANTLTVSTPWGSTQDSGTATGGTTTTLVDAGSNWLLNEFAGMTLSMPALGAGQNRTIVSNTNEAITVSPAWTTHETTATANGGGSSTISVAGTPYSVNEHANRTVEITAGANAGQSRKVLSNTGNTITIENTWTTSAGGTATAATATTLTDATQSWTVNAFAGMKIDILTGAGAGQQRTITSNTATQITVSSAWTTTPAFGDIYRVLRVPDGTSQFIVRDGPAIGTQYNVQNTTAPASGTKFELFKSACRIGGYDVTVAYDDAKYSIATDSGISSGSNTFTTLNDTAKAWKINQWAGTKVNITGGAGTGQSRTVVSNTATQLVVSPPWSSPSPSSGSVYNLGGIQDGGWVTADSLLTSGTATAGTSTTLTVSGTPWTTDQWAGKNVEIPLQGSSVTKAIVSNTANTLTIGAPGWSTHVTGTATGGSTTTLVDTSKSWTTNQWANKTVQINSGAGSGQTKRIVANTADTLTIDGTWTAPGAGSGYIIRDGPAAGMAFNIRNPGRSINCPGGSQYGTNDASLNCVSLGAGGTGLPQGPTGAGNLVTVVLRADGTRGTSSFTLTKQILEVDGTIIPADTISGTRRVTLCPDSAPLSGGDGIINSADLGATAQAFGKTTGHPLYTPQKDPNENGTIESGDLGIIAAVFNKRCNQP